ncbi:hypothetical protein A5707_22615 [Mycobacterium kyorinense]|uniref:Uncharacterized protein n=1 Tax=Mycobacterium kyorinense TaxID=487514 RepID=A0A1A2ZA37_9MYCO|nr:hypothetical protein A5707_22615 [Mycobacterium kyorinense]
MAGNSGISSAAGWTTRRPLPAAGLAIHLGRGVPPRPVMHGHAHPGNGYFRNGAADLLDWQAVRRGHPSGELAYTLITGMTTVDRQASQRELLDEYRRALADPETVALLEKSLSS